MKTIFLFCSLLFSLLGYTQESNFIGLHGLKNEKGEMFFETQGYSIAITKQKGSIDNKKLVEKIKKQKGVAYILTDYTEKDGDIRYRVLEAGRVSDSHSLVKAYQVLYLLQRLPDEMDIIEFNVLNKRDVLLEKELLNAYLEGKLDQYLLEGRVAKSISFVGRDVKLGTMCQWETPNAVTCKGGYLRWSEFSSLREASLHTDALVNVIDTSLIVSDSDIDVVFEGMACTARRIVYKPYNYNFHGNFQASYYLTAEVRGHFVSCDLGTWVIDKDDYELSPLVQQVMSIPKVPETAHNPFDYPNFYTYLPYTRGGAWNFGVSLLEVQTGVWLPMGNLRNTFNVAPYFTFYLGLPIKKYWAVDLGVGFGFPMHSNQFNYYYHDEVLRPKAQLIGGFNLRLRHQKKLAERTYLTGYVGSGVHFLSTNLTRDEKKDTKHELATYEIFTGANIKYKFFGLFVEYHYTPYFISSRVQKDLGRNALSTGLSISF